MAFADLAAFYHKSGRASLKCVSMCIKALDLHLKCTTHLRKVGWQTCKIGCHRQHARTTYVKSKHEIVMVISASISNVESRLWRSEMTCRLQWICQQFPVEWTEWWSGAYLVPGSLAKSKLRRQQAHLTSWRKWPRSLRKQQNACSWTKKA